MPLLLRERRAGYDALPLGERADGKEAYPEEGAAGEGGLLLDFPASEPQLYEEELVRLWEGQRFPREALRLREGQALQVVYRGRRDLTAGPDFLGALIADERGRLLRGDVELHVRSSSFVAHGHHRDPRYDNLVLHVVFHNDAGAPTLLRCGRRIAVVALAPWVARRAEELRLWLAQPSAWSEPCRSAVALSGWPEVSAVLDRLGQMRFRQKQARFAAALRREGANQALYEGLLRGAGLQQEPGGLLPSGPDTSLRAAAPHPRQRRADSGRGASPGQGQSSPQPASSQGRRLVARVAAGRALGTATLRTAGAGAVAVERASSQQPSCPPAGRLPAPPIALAQPRRRPLHPRRSGPRSRLAPSRRLAGARRELLAQPSRPLGRERGPRRRPHRPRKSAGNAHQRRAAVRCRLGRGALPRRPSHGARWPSSCACRRPAPTAARASWNRLSGRFPAQTVALAAPVFSRGASISTSSTARRRMHGLPSLRPARRLTGLASCRFEGSHGGPCRLPARPVMEAGAGKPDGCVVDDRWSRRAPDGDTLVVALTAARDRGH